MRSRLFLRLHELHLLAHADHADADGGPSPRGLRAPVRRFGEHGPRRASSPHPAGPQHPRLGDQEGNRLRAELGAGDQIKLTEYLDAIRDIERRIQTAEEQSGRKLPTLTRPAGVPDTFTEHAKLMFDMQVLAFQTDLTRVITFMMGREFGGRTYREIGIPEGYHALTHHMYKPDKIAKVIQIQTYHAKHFAYYLDKLRKTPDGDGSLLDHMTVLYGGGISDGNSHLHDNLPVVLVGGASGQMKGGRHVRYPKDTPMTNLLLTMLDTVGVHQDKLGDSTGHLRWRKGDYSLLPLRESETHFLKCRRTTGRGVPDRAPRPCCR